jgi:hypothetical protein
LIFGVLKNMKKIHNKFKKRIKKINLNIKSTKKEKFIMKKMKNKNK